MRRVLKAGGLCFLGVISSDTWPKSLLGVEEKPGEFWKREADGEPVLHTVFPDDEAAGFTTDWEVVSQEKHVRYLREVADELSFDSWMALHAESESNDTQQLWREKYATRHSEVRYAQLYFILRKPELMC